MIPGSEIRKADHPVGTLFVDRWSPRAMSGGTIAKDDLFRLFEAARWAPSSYNNQPWRFLYAFRDTPQWPLFFNLMGEANQVWTRHAAVLVVIVSKTTFDHNNAPSITHTFDAGAAWANLALQGFSQGFVVHGMQGFDYKRAENDLEIPPGFKVEAMVAIGKPGRKEDLPESLQSRESPSPRKPLSETVFEGRFPSGL